jgi:MoaA/NifB/PqqE/SkfB family radical SAM enzyme
MKKFNMKSNEMPDIVRLELTNTCNLKCPHYRHHSATNYDTYNSK